MSKSDTTFSVSAAKAFFEAAQKPKMRQAAVAAAKNPFVRSVAKQAAANPETRKQLIAVLEKQYAAKCTDEKARPPIKPKYDEIASSPTPPPHRGASGHTGTSSGYSTVSLKYSQSACISQPSSISHTTDYEKPLPPTPSTNSHLNSSATNGTIYPFLVNEMQELQLKIKDFSPTQPHAIVKYPFNGSHQDELSCAVGDIVILKRDIDDQWIYGMNNRTGNYGIVPFSFLDIRVPLGIGPSYSSVIATAIYDYDSNTPGDLTFRVHDQIMATERIGPEWIRGSLGGREGIFPANFVSCPNIDSLPMSQPSFQMAPLEKMTAAYDYSSGVQGDLEFKAGDTIEVVARLDQEWIQGRVNGNEGLCPLSFLAPYGTPVKSPKTRGLASIAALGGTGRTVTAIADHYSDDPKMLCFCKGDRIAIVEDVDTYWYRGKVEGFKTLSPGLFPKAIVKED